MLGEEYIKNFCSRWYILRTAWLYGRYGKNFVKTIIDASKKKDVLKVVDDQIGSPTSVQDLSFVISRLFNGYSYGLYHCSGDGRCSWYEFACEITKVFGLNVRVYPCSSGEYKTKALRPKFSVLDNFMLKLIGEDYFRDWKAAFKCFYENYKLG